MPQLKALAQHTDKLYRDCANVLLTQMNLPADSAAAAVYVPGRIEFLGKHTDYAGGRSLLLAVDKGFRLVAVPRKDKTLRVASVSTGGDVEQFEYGQTPPHAPGHWVNYVATVARRVAMNFSDTLDLKGADIAFVSDLPIAAGMSSSSALMVATFLGISGVNGIDAAEPYQREIKDSRLRLAEYLGCVENGQSFGTLTGEKGVGTFGGSEDHTAMLCGQADKLIQCSFAPSVFECDVPFPKGITIVVGSSGVEAVKTAAAMELYNRASLRSRKACEVYNRSTKSQCRNLRQIALQVGTAGMATASAAIAAAATAEETALDLPGRWEQFFREDQEIIPAVADLLAAGKADQIAPLIDASHAGAVHGLQNQVPQTNFLQSSAKAHGAIAASAFGAGFGGSVWAMAPSDQAAAFAKAWAAEYHEKFPHEAARSEFFLTHPGSSARVEE